MPNMAKTIASHNSKVLREDNPVLQPKMCSCEGGTPCCPVQGACEQTGVVYRASVTETISGKTETYTGLTGRAFKNRLNLFSSSQLSYLDESCLRHPNISERQLGAVREDLPLEEN